MGPSFQNGSTRVVDGETLAGCCAIARSPHGRIDILFGSVITTEAHLAFSGARTHSVARVFTVSPNMLPVCASARFKPVHMFSWQLACQQSMLSVQHRLRLTIQHVYGHTGNLGNECADHAAALGALGLVSNHNPRCALGSSQL